MRGWAAISPHPLAGPMGDFYCKGQREKTVIFRKVCKRHTAAQDEIIMKEKVYTKKQHLGIYSSILLCA